MAQLMPLPLTVSCFSKIQIGFIFLILAHPGSPGQWAVKRGCVCVCVDYLVIILFVCKTVNDRLLLRVCKAVCLCIITNRKVHQPCKTGDRLIIFKDHDIKGRSVLFDSSVPVDNSQQKEPAAVSLAAFILYCSMVLCLQCFDAVG